jgi:serine/threonine-protein kinase
VQGERTDERSDLYSLGISLYEMVTGERPFHGDSSFSLMAAHINQAPTPPVELQPDMPAGLNQIILTSIAKSPAERFQSADAFRNAVKIVLRDLQESKTLVQGSQDATAAGSRTPLPHVRTGPITRPKTQTPMPIPAYAAPTASSAVTAAAASRPSPNTVATPPPPAPAQPARNRGLLISLGAVVVLVVLVAAGLYMPRGKKASAADDTTSGNKQPQVVTQQPVETKPAEVAPPEPPKKQPSGDRLSAGDSQAAAAAAAAARAKAAELDRLEREIDQLTVRAASVNGSVEGIRRQQEAMGVGLRGDIASHLASMQVNLAKAQDAIGSGDVERAKRYAGLADRDVEALEKFLGR